MNSPAFTFIAEVGEYFHSSLSEQLGATNIASLDKATYGDLEIKYLCPEYSESNAVNEDGSYTDEGWYICEDEQKAGLLSDFKFRHNAEKYAHPSDKVILLLHKLLCYLPPCIVLSMAIRSWSLLSTAENLVAEVAEELIS